MVIGVPGHMNAKKEGSDQEALGKLIEINTDVPVVYFEEMFTTKMAQANLRQAGVKQAGKVDDAEAARIILQEWIDKSKF